MHFDLSWQVSPSKMHQNPHPQESSFRFLKEKSFIIAGGDMHGGFKVQLVAEFYT